MSKHPSLDIVESHGTELSGKKIVLCVAGSVAAYKSIELARLLMRHGANVKCVMSGASTKLIKPDYMKWATGNNVVTKLTGNMEHIDLASSIDLYAATEPATHRTIFFPESSVPWLSTISKDGCLLISVPQYGKYALQLEKYDFRRFLRIHSRLF